MNIHGNRYDYSKVNYIHSKIKVEIVCSIHGSFWQEPRTHLQGYGCKKCADLSLTTKSFINRAHKIHKNNYLYYKAVYKNFTTKVEIICKVHGSFWQTPGNHLSGRGCFICCIRHQLTAPEFAKKAILIHGEDKYDYSKVEYKNNKIKVIITCLRCNTKFSQTPYGHLNGNGCPRCVSRISKSENKWLNFNKVLKRQYKLKINNKRFEVDGYDPKTNTIYEFLGDYWHGNPKKYKPNEINKRIKKTFGELYKETMSRIKLFEENGYNVKYIWERDYKA